MEKFVKSKQLFFHKMTSWKGVSDDTLKFHFTQKMPDDTLKLHFTQKMSDDTLKFHFPSFGGEAGGA